ncbi:MAG: hypothetical protein II707_03350, partial [Spirochaetales bacterium]|nr:hypothetical protein [Spirochaetales bacterium]
MNGQKCVCADCFVNQECKQLISQKGKIGNCSYCCQGNKKVMEIDDFVTEWYFVVSDRLEP